MIDDPNTHCLTPSNELARPIDTGRRICFMKTSGHENDFPYTFPLQGELSDSPHKGSVMRTYDVYVVSLTKLK